MHDEVARLLPARTGHFRFESGHHGERWLDLERLCLQPEPIERLATALAERVRRHDIEIVCGPLVEGAFVALMVASTLDLPFVYTQRFAAPDSRGLFPVKYRLPRVLRPEVRGRRVAIVNDVVGAGSAIRGTWEDLVACGARPTAIATLAVMGDSAAAFASREGLALETLASFPFVLWTPDACPLCAAGVQLETPDS
jgi:orotate phosphoribosyltransferase